MGFLNVSTTLARGHQQHDEAAALPVKLPRPLSAKAETFGLSLDGRYAQGWGGFLGVPMASMSEAGNNKEQHHVKITRHHTHRYPGP